MTRSSLSRSALRAIPALIACAAVALGAARPADAHALLVETSPDRDAALSAAPDAVVLTFTEDPDPALSDVTVLDVSGRVVSQGAAAPVAGQPRRLRVGVSGIGEGVYTVSWRVLSKVDGHVTGGAFAFGVGVSPEAVGAAELPEATVPAPSPAEVAGRFLLYVGLFGLVGSGVVGAAVLPRPDPLPRWLPRASWTIATLGLGVFAVAQWRGSAAPVGAFASSPVGRALVGRVAFLGVVAVLLVVAGRWSGRPVWAAVGAAALAVVWVHVSAGHAAAAEPALLRIAVQWTHVAAAAAWIGGLAVLLASLPRVDPPGRLRVVGRYATVAATGLFVVAGTGTARAVNEVGSFGGLASTSYGRVVLAKVALLAALAVLGAFQRWRTLPRRELGLRGLGTIGRAEIAVAAVVLVASGVLATLVPSQAETAAEERRSVVATGSDFARTLAVRLEVAPGLPGANAFEVDVSDPDSGDAVEADRVAVRFVPLGGVSVESSTVDLDPGGEPGTWEGKGAQLAVGGVWRAIVLVERGARSVEVPLTLATRCRTTDIASPDLPTLHDVEVGGGGTAQGYVDPGRPGANEVHFTFFDAGGTELSVTGSVDITAFPTGADAEAEEPESLEVRRFGPGHFIGDARLGEGSWRFDVMATTDGDRLSACFEEEIG